MEVQTFLPPVRGYPLGRVYLVPCANPLGGPAPQALLQEAIRVGARILLIDATDSPYADSDGLRWLLRLKSAADERGVEMRIAAREKGRVWRNIALLRAGFSLYASVQRAWGRDAANTAAAPCAA